MTDASFAGWTLENCRFWADESGQGTAFDVASKAPGVGAETRRPGEFWQGAATEENANDGANVGYVGCDFADATLKNVLFDRRATITFAQFAASRSFKKDEICALFGFPLGFEWDFSGKNVERSSKEPPPIAKSKAELTTVVSRGFDGAPLDWRRYDDNPWDDRRPRDERLRVRANKEPIRTLATAGE